MGAEKFKVIGTECADVVVLIIICIFMYWLSLSFLGIKGPNPSGVPFGCKSDISVWKRYLGLRKDFLLQTYSEPMEHEEVPKNSIQIVTIILSLFALEIGNQV
jgi:hypothetical protein